MAAHDPEQRGEHAGDQTDAGVQDGVEHGIVVHTRSQQPDADDHVSDQQNGHGVDDRRLLVLDALIGR
jgi:hypothetical protein